MLYKAHLKVHTSSWASELRANWARMTTTVCFIHRTTVDHIRSHVLLGTSLVAQGLRISLPTQGTRVQALVREDPTCRGATKPVQHNY